MWLRQSTSVVISFGPFLDKTDGVTLETGLVSAIDHATTGDQGAVEFKPVSAGGTVPIPVAMRSYQQRRVVV